MQLLIQWLIGTVAVLIASYLLPGVKVDGFFAAFIVAFIIGLLNAFLRPLLLILTLPINLVTLGLFTFVINAFIILLASYVVKGFRVDGFWWALIFSIILAFVNMLLSRLFT